MEQWVPQKPRRGRSGVYPPVGTAVVEEAGAVAAPQRRASYDQKLFCHSNRYIRVNQTLRVEAGLHASSRGDRRDLHTVLLFFVFTYLLTWTCWLPVVTGRISTARPSFSFLWLLGVFCPAVVAVGMTARREGSVGVRALLGKMFIADVGVRWYLFALTYMVAIKLTVAVVFRIGMGQWPHFGTESIIMMLGGVLASTPVQAGEEIGWRGFALPRLAAGMGLAPASVLLGVVWAGWHVPQFFLVGADTYRQSFPIWAIEVVAISVAFAWLYSHTNGSLLLAMLMHSAINNTKSIVPAGNPSPSGVMSLHASAVMYVTAICLWGAAAYFLARMRTVSCVGGWSGDLPSGDKSPYHN